jgi:hypothetical protein
MINEVWLREIENQQWAFPSTRKTIDELIAALRAVEQDRQKWRETACALATLLTRENLNFDRERLLQFMEWGVV